MQAGRLFGTNLLFNNFFLILIFLYGVAGRLTEALIVFGSAIFHEIIHALVAAGLGIKVRSIEVLPFGGVARLEGRIEEDPSREITVAFAGPLGSFAVAGICIVLRNNNIYDGEWLRFILSCNLVIGLFNLIPILPLDGGRILRAVLAMRLSFRRATAIAAAIGKALTFVYGGLSALGLYFGYTGIMPLVLAFFLYYSLDNEENNSAFLSIQMLSRRRGRILSEGLLPADMIVAVDRVPVKDVARRFIPKKYHLVVVVDGKMELLGMITETELLDAMLNKGIDIPLGNLL